MFFPYFTLRNLVYKIYDRSRSSIYKANVSLTTAFKTKNVPLGNKTEDWYSTCPNFCLSND